MDEKLKKDFINTMIDAMISVSRGNYNTKISVCGVSEDLDALASGFNWMIEDIRQSTMKLGYIGERTEEILSVIDKVAAGELDFHLFSKEKEDDFDVLKKGIYMLALNIKTGIEAVERERNYSNNIIRSMADALIIMEPNGEIKSINNAAVSLFGYTEEELVGRNIDTLFVDKTHKISLINRKSLMSRPIRDFDNEMVFLSKKGEEIPVSMNISRMKDEAGRVTEIIILASDMSVISKLINKLITRSKDLEKSNKQLKETTAELIQAEKLSALGELSASITHELYQPLNAAKIICQTLLKELRNKSFEKDSAKEDIEEIVAQINGMSEIIDQMRTFSRRAESEAEQKIYVNNVIENIFKILARQLIDEDIKIEKRLDSDIKMIKGNPTQFGQVIMNLVNNAKNALDQSKREEKSIKIRTRSSKDGESVIIEVVDNGCGIPEDLREKVFNPFFTTKDFGKGTGLGLSIVRRIVEKYKGTIQLESRENEGTSFKLIFPAASVEDE